MATQLVCPRCESANLHLLEEIEVLTRCSRITDDGCEFSGDAEYLHDNSTAFGFQCRDCYWELDLKGMGLSEKELIQELVKLQPEKTRA